MNYIMANDPQRMGHLHTFSVGPLEEILNVASIYFQLIDLCDEEAMSKVMIQYD